MTRTGTKLTITKATTQARRHVDSLMPGVLATVESKGSWDLATDTRLIVTTITFPKGHPARHCLVKSLALGLSGYVKSIDDSARIVVTRKV
jgi:hypothetical protein